MLTVEKLKSLSPHSIILTGSLDIDNPFPTFCNEPETMKIDYVAVRGGIHDWAIYCARSGHKTTEDILNFGEKITDEEVIKRCVPCDSEAFKMYRY